MSESAVTHSTFVIEREYPATPERVFAAFADPAQKRRWFAEGTPLPAGTAIHNETRYQDIVPNRRIVFVYTMAMGEQVFSASQTTVELLPTGQGTRLVHTEQAAFFENADGPEIREAGCRQLLEALAREFA